MARTGYPTLITQTRRLAKKYDDLFDEMVGLTSLSGTGLTKLQAVSDALAAVLKDTTNLPPYRPAR